MRWKNVGNPHFPAFIPDMIEVSSEQMFEIEEAYNRNFVNAVGDFLRKEMPQEVHAFSSLELEAWILDCQSRASKYGIDEPVPVTQFICLSLAAGKGFHDAPEVDAYLRDNSLNQTEKMQALIEEMSDVG